MVLLYVESQVNALGHGYADCEFPIHFSETDCPHFFHFRAAPYCQIQKFEYLFFDFETETTHCIAYENRTTALGISLFTSKLSAIQRRANATVSSGNRRQTTLVVNEPLFAE
jgi:hypothetical protein